MQNVGDGLREQRELEEDDLDALEILEDFFRGAPWLQIGDQSNCAGKSQMEPMYSFLRLKAPNEPLE